MRICVFSFALVFSAVVAVCADEAPGRVPDAEEVAQRYMTAFFHSDLRAAASLTHPETLQQIKRAFLQERAAAKAAGKEAEFLSKSRIAESPDLASLDLVDFYAAVVGGSRQSAPDAAAAMKSTTVDVKGSERAENERVIVTLAITTPAGETTRTQDSRLLLAQVDGQWKVIGNAK